MLRFIFRRVLAGALLIFAVSTIAYVLLYLGAGDTARQLLGPNATQAVVDQKANELGLNEPLLVRYFAWVAKAATGDFGMSWITSQPVTEAIASRLPVTLSLVIGTTIITAVIGSALGVWAAQRRGAADRIVQIVSVLGFAIPGFLLAIFLVNIFALNLKWFRPTGYVAFDVSISAWIGSVTLPIVALAVGSVAAFSAQVRGSVLDASRQDWVRTLRSRGLSEGRVIYKHVLRNAGGPALAVLAVQFVGLLGGAVVVEQIFAIPGLGPIATQATNQGDIPSVMGLVVITAAIVVIVNIVIEILHGFLNPKARVA